MLRKEEACKETICKEKVRERLKKGKKIIRIGLEKGKRIPYTV